ncbi:hypothetical protein D0Z70_24315 [Sphingobium terrigena]|uniref:Uncharacterized protein n=1 Tax=Sphingobium terrigena TaxID=2304063 RepID=A0A418YGI6_9SPHN|nr:hypothetical protein D0Z70_24315 [Sphingobium terrigena]
MMDSTSGIKIANPPRVTRPKEFTEQLAFLVKEGTGDRIDAVRGNKKKADFLREAVESAIRRQEKKRLAS